VHPEARGVFPVLDPRTCPSMKMDPRNGQIQPQTKEANRTTPLDARNIEEEHVLYRNFTIGISEESL